MYIYIYIYIYIYSERERGFVLYLCFNGTSTILIEEQLMDYLNKSWRIGSCYGFDWFWSENEYISAIAGDGLPLSDRERMRVRERQTDRQDESERELEREKNDQR